MANYKLTNDYWEASGIYDIGQGKTQREINKVAVKSGEAQTVTDDIVTITDGVEGMPVNNLTVNITPAQDLHGQANPYPAGSGKNLLPTIASYSGNGITATVGADGSITFSGTTTAQVVLTIPFTASAGTTLTFSGHNSAALGSSGIRFRLIGDTNYELYLTTANSYATWTLAGNIESARFQISSGVALSGTIYPQIERGSTVTDYAPYSNICPISGWTGANIVVSPTQDAQDGTTYHITFPNEAGTVYGGTLDVTNGVLTVTDGVIASYNGETLPSTWISDRDVYESGTTPSTGAQVVYKLSTTNTYTLTPTEVKMLLGQNNFWADCGDVNVQYGAYLTVVENQLGEKIPKVAVAPIEKTTTASKAYSVNELFFMGDKLYIATSAIASGGTFTVGTNCDETTLGEQITALLNA